MYKINLLEGYTVICFACPILDHFTRTVSKVSYNLGFGGDLKVLDICLQDNSIKPNTLVFNVYPTGPEGLIWVGLQSAALK